MKLDKSTMCRALYIIFIDKWIKAISYSILFLLIWSWKYSKHLITRTVCPLNSYVLYTVAIFHFDKILFLFSFFSFCYKYYLYLRLPFTFQKFWRMVQYMLVLYFDFILNIIRWLHFCCCCRNKYGNLSQDLVVMLFIKEDLLGLKCLYNFRSMPNWILNKRNECKETHVGNEKVHISNTCNLMKGTKT